MPSIKLIAVVTGLILGAGSGVALCQGAEYSQPTQSQHTEYIALPVSVEAPVTSTVTTTPASAPVPTAASSVLFVTIRGIACIDRDMSGVCTADEARVPNVIVRNSDGVPAVTDSSGEYLLQAAPRSELDIVIPTGYQSINGNLHHYRLLMADTRNVDIALTIDTTYTSPGTREGSANIHVQRVNDGQSTNDNQLLPITNTNLRVGLVVAVILAALLVFIGLRIMQRLFVRSVNQQDYAQRDQQTKNIANRLEYAEGWQLVAGQVVADTLHQMIAIDEGAGILNAIAEPSPRFTIVTRDRRAIMFTTNPGFLRKAQLIRSGDRIVDVTAHSAVNHTSIRMLWQHICTMRNMQHVMPPETAHWYMVVRVADNRPQRKRQFTAGRRIVIPKPKTKPYQPWRGPA